MEIEILGYRLSTDVCGPSCQLYIIGKKPANPPVWSTGGALVYGVPYFMRESRELSSEVLESN